MKCTKEADIRGTYVLSISFFLVFTANSSIQNLQSSLNQEEGLGTASLSIYYTTFIVAAVLAPLGIRIFGCKKVIVSAWISHVIYTGTNAYPKWWTLVPSSVFLGINGGLLWTARGVCLTTFSSSLSERNGIDRESALNHLNSIFNAIYQLSGITGSIISSTVLAPENRNTSVVNTSYVCGAGSCPVDPVQRYVGEQDTFQIYILIGIFTLFSISGLVITLLFLPSIDTGNPKEDSSMKTTLLACVNGLCDTKLMMLSPLMMAITFSKAVLRADYTKAFVSCPLGIQMIGFLMAAYSAVTMLSSVLMGRISRFAGRQILVATALMLDVGIYGVLIFWHPQPSQVVYVLLILIVWALADSIWNIQLNVIIAVMFPDKPVSTFALFHCLESLGYAISFFFSTTICVLLKLYITLGLFVISVLLYTSAEIKHSRCKQVGITKVGMKVSHIETSGQQRGSAGIYEEKTRAEESKGTPKRRGNSVASTCK